MPCFVDLVGTRGLCVVVWRLKIKAVCLIPISWPAPEFWQSPNGTPTWARPPWWPQGCISRSSFWSGQHPAGHFECDDEHLRCHAFLDSYPRFCRTFSNVVTSATDNTNKRQQRALSFLNINIILLAFDNEGKRSNASSEFEFAWLDLWNTWDIAACSPCIAEDSDVRVDQDLLRHI